MKTKIYKLLSILLTVAIVFSACLCAFGAVSAEVTTLEYYVSNASGSDSTEDGTTLATAFATVGAAVTKAVNDTSFNVAGNVLTVNVENTTGSGVYLWGTVPTHNFTLKLVGLAENTRVQDNSSNHMILGGPIEIYNIHFLSNASGNTNYELSNKDVTFGEGTKVNVDRKLYIGTKANANVSTSQTIKFNGVTNSTTSPISVYLANRGISVEYNAPINITANNSSFYPKFLFGNANTAYTTTYNSLVNFDIKDITAIEFGAAGGTYSFGDDAAVQIINSTGLSYTDSAGVLTDISDKLWVLNNDSSYKDVLSFTDTAGKYAVAEGYTVTAHNAEGNLVATSAEGYLDIAGAGNAAGTYDIQITSTVEEEGLTYFVSNSGSDSTEDGTTLETAFKTVGAAVTKALGVDGFNAAGNVLTVNVENTTGSGVYLWGTVPAHNFTLKLVGSEAETRVQSDSVISLGGPTELEKIYLLTAGSNSYNFNSKTVKFGASTKVNSENRNFFIGGKDDAIETISTSQAIEFNGGSVNGSNVINQISVYLSNRGKNATFEASINITANNSGFSPKFTFGVNNTTNTATYNSLVNFNIKDVSAIEFGTSLYSFGDGAAIQVMNSSGKEITLPTLYKDSTDTSVEFENIWILNNTSDYADALSFTDTAGTFAIDTTVYSVTATNGTSTENGADGKLVLGAGTWDITITRNTKSYNYTVGTGGEYATVAEAIAAANTAGAAAGDEVTVQIVGEDAVMYLADGATAPAEHGYTLKITSDISDGSATVNFYGQKAILGDTIFENVKITSTDDPTSDNGSNNNYLFLDGKNVTFEENVTLARGARSIYTGTYNSGKTYTENQRVTLKNECSGSVTITTGDQSAKPTHNADITIDITNAKSCPTLRLSANSQERVLNCNININLLNKATLTSVNNNVGVTVNKAFTVVAESSFSYDLLSAFTATNGKYVFTNKTQQSDIISPSETAGVYNVNSENTVRAIGSDGSYVDSVSNQITLADGIYEYILAFPTTYDSKPTVNADFIDYGTAINGKSALNNTLVKIKKGEDVNVVYYGGSITAGQEASNDNITSWRGLISTWLEANAPSLSETGKAKITNINSAIGGTGTFFGNYRLKEAVLDQAPDLLFIEFSINDLYDNDITGTTDKTQAAKQFESIVRAVREELPECDIVTVLTTDQGRVDNLIADPSDLHEQALGHEMIAQKYGLPVLYVGKKLATMFTAADVTDGEIDSTKWAEYIADSVHPNDNGYSVYAEVVEEFMANSLFYTETEDTETTPHSMPTSIVSDSLLDGDIKVYEASADMAADSVTLGGGTFTVATGDSQIRYFDSYAKDDIAGKTVAFEFTGTELGIVAQFQGFTGDASYGVVITEKATSKEVYNETVTVNGINPGILASGLDYGTYVAKITFGASTPRFHGFTTRDETKQTIRESQASTYYVGTNANGNGTGTEADPYADINTAIKAVNALGQYGENDTVSLKVLYSDTAISWGVDAVDSVVTLPEHNYTLDISSYTTKATIGESGYSILFNGPVKFDNIKITGSGDGYYIALNGNDAYFGSGVTVISANRIALGGIGTITEVTEDQNVTINMSSCSKIHLADVNNATTFNADINLEINNSSLAPTIFFSTKGSTGVAATYNGNVNINLKASGAVTLKKSSSTSNAKFGTGSALQIINSAGSTITEETYTSSKVNKWILNNNTGDAGVVKFDSTAGEYVITKDIVVTATSDSSVVNSSNGALILAVGTWTLTSDGLFEDFNNMTADDFAAGWIDKAGLASINSGKLVIKGTAANLLDNKYVVEYNTSIGLNQYISVDIKGTNFATEAGAAIFARLDNHNTGYRFYVREGIIQLTKRSGNTNNSSFDTTSLIGRGPTSSYNSGNWNTEFSFDADHTYRLAISVVDSATENNTFGNPYTYVRIIVLDITTNTVMVDETFKDINEKSEASTYVAGTNFGFGTLGSSNVITEFDNLYYSSKCFRGGDEGSEKGDINRDGVYDIRDLVYANEHLNDSTVEVVLSVADKNYDGNVTLDDLSAICKELLNDLWGEFDYIGQQDATADTLRQEILGSANGDYSSATNTYYVSSDAVGGNDGISPDTPWTLTELNSNYESLKEGDAVLFKRGSVFRLEGGYQSSTIIGTNRTYYAYIAAKAGVTYGAYTGTEEDASTAKPLFKDSAKDYAVESLWSETAEGSNIWKCAAPEIIIDATIDQEDGRTEAVDNSATNIIFDGGKSVGVRREYLADLHTIYKNGYFTYDEASGMLYLYCDKGNPADVYNSIEVSRGLYGFMIDSAATDVVIDNLAFQGFGAGAISGLSGNSNITVTNCEIGFSGGVQTSSNDDLFLGNAVGFWNGGANSIVSHNWIYQTFDSAISPQGESATSYDGFTVTNNLLEYNNCDIEFFGENSTFIGWNISGNMIRFTSLGWGSRESEVIRGIQGVIRADFENATITDFNFSNNTIDSPGMEIFNINNAVTIETVTYNTGTTTDPTTATTNVITKIYKFDDAESTFEGNRYYFNPYIRNLTLVVRDYKTAVANYVSAIENNAVLYEENSLYYTVDGENIIFNIWTEKTDKRVTGNDGSLVSFLQLVDSGASAYWFKNQTTQAE